MKKFLFLLLLSLMFQLTFACDVCKKQQPKILESITHGAGPQSNWDYVVVWFVVLLIGICLFYTVKHIIRPGEKGADHIKNSIFYQL